MPKKGLLNFTESMGLKKSDYYPPQENQVYDYPEQDSTQNKSLKDKLVRFSFMSAFNELTKSRCNSTDNHELDVLEAFKFLSFILL